MSKISELATSLLTNELTTSVVVSVLAQPDDPTEFTPDGPSFDTFSGFATITQVVIGAILFAAFIIGTVTFFVGLTKFKAGDKSTGRAAQGVASMWTGVIMVVGSLVGARFFDTLVGVAGTVGETI